jgi:hypothetical protein
MVLFLLTASSVLFCCFLLSYCLHLLLTVILKVFVCLCVQNSQQIDLLQGKTSLVQRLCTFAIFFSSEKLSHSDTYKIVSKLSSHSRRSTAKPRYKKAIQNSGFSDRSGSGSPRRSGRGQSGGSSRGRKAGKRKREALRQGELAGCASGLHYTAR